MSNEFSCYSCLDKDDCIEYTRQSVRDVSHSHGLCCHSSIKRIVTEEENR
jgi:hypothetical protein